MYFSNLYNRSKQKASFLFLFISIIGFLSFQTQLVKAQEMFEKTPYIIFNNNTHGMRLLWQNTSSCECNIAIVNSVSKSQRLYKSIEINNSHQHILNLDSLEVGILYAYQITCNEDIKSGNFRAKPDNSLKNFSFFAYGDTRTYPENHNLVANQMLKLIKANKTNQTFIVSTGDLVANGDNESDWTEQFFNPEYKGIQQMLANMPYMTAMGNHEGQGNLFEKYFPFDYKTKNQFYFSFDYGIVHFFVIDQFADYSEGSEQYKWLIQDLENSKSQWNIAMIHKPGYTAGGHKDSKDVQEILQPIFKKYNVKLVLAGHNHYYARAEVDGITHITTGGGGAPLYDIKKKRYIITVDKSYHFCKIDVSPDFLNISAIRSDGSLIESFKINR